MNQIGRSPAVPMPGTALVPTSFGELTDKITILEIKSAAINDPAKQAHVLMELEVLRTALYPFEALVEDTRAERSALTLVNRRLWDVEDALRELERRQDFGDRFVMLARSVYRLNDERAAIKRRLNEQAGSQIVEEKFFRGGR